MTTTVEPAVVTVNAADLRSALIILADAVDDIADIADKEMAPLYRLEAAIGARIWVPTRDMRAAEFVANVPGIDLEQAYRLVDFIARQND